MSPALPAVCASAQVSFTLLTTMSAFGFLIVKPGQMPQGVTGQGKTGRGVFLGGTFGCELPFPCEKKFYNKKGTG
jgi:hypothetical protein